LGPRLSKLDVSSTDDSIAFTLNGEEERDDARRGNQGTLLMGSRPAF
jgi:hypothetical protein